MKQPELEIYQDIDKQWRWRVRAVNGAILANSSEGYRNRLDCVRGYQLTQESEAVDHADDDAYEEGMGD